MADARPTEPRAARHLRALPASEVDTSDWPAQAADSIERVVQGVRDKTTGPAITAARWLVFGVFGIVAGTAVLVLLTIAAVRVLDAYLPSSVFGDEHVWAAHGLLGLLLSFAGAIMLAKRHPRDPASR